MHNKDKVKHVHAEFEMKVPQLVFSVEEDDNDDVGADAMSMTSSERCATCHTLSNSRLYILTENILPFFGCSIIAER